MLNHGEILDLYINALGINGEGVAKHHGFTVFVDGALPNETVAAKIGVVKSSYAKGDLIEVKKADEHRVEPPCSRYHECGGCHIMHLAYEAQRARKTQSVKDALKHIGGIVDANVLPCIASPEPFFYRNKIQLPVGNKDGEIVTGFYRRGSHDIVPYERCLVHHSSMEDTVNIVKALLPTSRVESYNEGARRGTLRHIIIRANSQGQQLIGLVTTGQQKNQIRRLAEAIKQSMPVVVGVIESINQKVQNVILGDRDRLLVGDPFIQEDLAGLTFQISLASFFQVNIKAATILYETALDFAKIDSTSRVLDAYCGTGTMSLLAAKRAQLVIGIECVQQAVHDAKKNAHRNNMANAHFYVGHVEDNVELFNNIDIALVNPPRKGLEPRVTTAIDSHGPQRVVYVSCNPATLARDVRMLTNYNLIKVQPVDMFPQTMHVESVALLERR